MNTINSIILVKDCYPALERFWNNYTQSPELHLECILSSHLMELGGNRKKTQLSSSTEN